MSRARPYGATPGCSMSGREGGSNARDWLLQRTVSHYAPTAVHDVVEHFARLEVDESHVRRLGLLATDFIAASRMDKIPRALPTDLGEAVQRFAVTLAAHDPDDVKHHAHQAFVIAERITVRRATLDRVDRTVIMHLASLLRNLEQLVLDEIRRVCEQERERGEAQLRYAAATTLNDVVADSMVARAASEALFQCGVDRGDTPRRILPSWLKDDGELLTFAVVRPKRGGPQLRLSDLSQSSLAAIGQQESVVAMPTSTVTEAVPQLVRIYPQSRVAVGLSVRVGQAASSLAWCRRALSLQEAGALADTDQPIWCSKALDLLVFGADLELVRLVGGRIMSPFEELSEYRRKILVETLEAFVHRPDAGVPALARQLGRHPQTVRYRLRHLRALLGDVMDDGQQVMLLRLAFSLNVIGPTRSRMPAPTVGRSYRGSSHRDDDLAEDA